MGLVDLVYVQAFFFRAMRAGYASGAATKTQVIERPGFKEIRFQEGDFLLIDEWGTNRDSNKSVGTTRIWHDGTLVWFMSYGGYYPEKMIHFLKQSLHLQYRAEDPFLGCRGPRLVTDRVAGRIYLNRPVQNDFGRFNGREEIIDMHTGEVGYHDYWGMSLI